MFLGVPQYNGGLKLMISIHSKGKQNPNTILKNHSGFEQCKRILGMLSHQAENSKLPF